MPATDLTVSDLERSIARVVSGLGEQERATLLAFAEFLQSRQPRRETAPLEPLAIPRPDVETVIEAIRRLTQTYPMIARRRVMNDTANLMTQHALHRRPAIEVIDELEVVFRRHYEGVIAERGEEEG